MQYKKALKLRLILSVLLIAIVLPGVSAVAEANDEKTINEIMSYASEGKSMQEWLDGELSEKAGRNAEWYIFALKNMFPELDYSNYRKSLEKYVNDNKISSPVTRQKCALALFACGSNIEYIDDVMNTTIGKSGIMSYVFGLNLLNNGLSSSDNSVEQVLSLLLSLQLENGGWALFGDNLDPDVTAMTIQAISKYKERNDVLDSIEKAVNALSSLQLNDGDYIAYGNENPETVAQVIIALCSVGIDCLKDERFIKNGNTLFDGMMKYKSADGSVSHTKDGLPNENALAQVICALAALHNKNIKEKGFFSFKTDTEDISEEKSEIIAESRETFESNVESDNDTEKEQPSLSDAADGQIDPKSIIAVVIIVISAFVVIIMAVKKKKLNDIVLFLMVSMIILAAVMLINVESVEEHRSLISKENLIGKATLSIKNNTNGDYIINNEVFDIDYDDTVYNVLIEASRKHGFEIDTDNGYVKAIDGLYEFENGPLSGWIYKINGIIPNENCKNIKVNDGDVIEWIYTSDGLHIE